MRQVQKWLDKIKEKAEEKNIQSKSEILELKKSVVGTIINYAESEKIDLIIVGSRGRSGLKKLLLGSVAQGVLTYAHCPVLVVKCILFYFHLKLYNFSNYNDYFLQYQDQDNTFISYSARGAILENL